MSKSRLEWKVGLFVFMGLVLLAVLLIQFSKGASFFKSSYDIRLQSSNVSGLKENADVLMSGVKVGSVSDIVLAPDGKSVDILLTIYSRFQIHKDARFAIEQAGFLGDQYVSIVPTENKQPVFHDGETAKAEPPFNFQEVARSASGLVSRVEQAAEELHQTLADMRRNLLNENTLTNLSSTIANLRTASEDAVITMENLNALMASNAPAISLAATNLVDFSVSMNTLGSSLNEIVATNEPAINSAVKNVQASTETLKNLVADIEAGKGLAGNLLRNEQLADSVSQITYNLSVTSSNLNRLGLWGILWRKKGPPPAPPADRLSTPKDQSRRR